MLGTQVAGAYTATYQPTGLSQTDIGFTERGYLLRWSYNYDQVENTDSFGQGTLIESFYQGVNIWVGGTFKEYKQGPLYAVAPWQTFAPTGANTFALGVVGRAATYVGGPLILTATAGTPAASSPASLTATMALIDNGHQVEQLYGPTHRMTPFLFRIYPYSSTGIKYFTTT